MQLISLSSQQESAKIILKGKGKQMHGEVLVKHIAKTKSAISELPFHY